MPSPPATAASHQRVPSATLAASPPRPTVPASPQHEQYVTVPPADNPPVEVHTTPVTSPTRSMTMRDKRKSTVPAPRESHVHLFGGS